MPRGNKLVVLFVCLLASIAWQTVRAENEGLSELDKATDLQIKAKDLGDLQEVADLCEEALKKGLDEANTKFAKQLLSSALYDRANRMAESFLETRPPNPRWRELKEQALANLKKATEYSPDMGEAYILEARLHALPGGSREDAIKAAGEAARSFKDDNNKRARALVLRAALQEDPEKQLEDFNAAIEADPASVEAWQGRAIHFLAKEDFEKAASDFNKVLESEGDNPGVHNALAEALFNLKKYDEALTHVNKAIELRPELGVSYVLRARIHAVENRIDEAIADLDKAVEQEPRDLAARLLRARLNHFAGEYAKARADVDRILRSRPDVDQAILLRSMISAAEGKFGEAISDVQQLLKADPNNVDVQYQLGALYVADGRPRKAIEIYSNILNSDEDNWMVLRSRADALLSVGKHAEAIEDYERAIKIEPKDDGLLNNFAWVLATSPDDEVRDGKRAIELAKRANEVTEYKRPHILSTLAAAYAETGDFEEARKWSEKAVELGKEELKDQLRKELESYRENKPWRELQNVEEKPEPVVAPSNAVDT